jgi:lipopolysaccharide biosynthesis glycosyltransferase
MTESDVITIVCAADHSYAAPLAAMVQSILATTVRALRLFVLDAGLAPGDRERLEACWAASRVDVSWVDLDFGPLAGLPLWGRMKAVTYARLLIPERLPPSVERAVWLDCDLVVNHDLGELWATDLAGHPVCAVQDLVAPYVSSRLGIATHRELGMAESTPYFNAGVMLIDVRAWRAADISERAFAYLRRYAPHVTLWDQEGLNVAVAGRWRALDARWNMIASVTGRPFFVPEHLAETVYREAAGDPWIVHFAGTWKPWLLARNHPFRALYFAHLHASGWVNQRPESGFRVELMRLYDASLRDRFYGLERWWLRASRRLSRRSA